MIWVFFILLIFGLLALDLGVFHKTDTKVTMKESVMWTVIWVLLALVFGVVLYWMYDRHILGLNQADIPARKAMLEYFTGYLIEESLSLDNIFVIAMIFGYFRIEPRFQHKVLFWGILGAVFFRLIMILLGTAFVQRFEWSTYVFGAILVYSAIRMLFSGEEETDFQQSLAVRLLSRVYPIDWNVRNGKYFVRRNGRRMATGLFATLVVVEFSDILFAVDSIPAIFSVTEDPFIVFTSNIFAILGLRNLYFFLSGMMEKFRYIKYSLVLVLLFVGGKMLLIRWIGELSPVVSLVVILGLLTGGVIFSLFRSGKEEKLPVKKLDKKPGIQ